jgi:histidine triad (HIT) family protein
VSCLFCRIGAGEEPAHRVLDEPDVVAFLDVRPVFKGHVLVTPRRHVDTLPDLPPAELPVLMAAVQRTCRAVTAALGAQGTFVAVNNVVPRTKGDGLRGFFWPRTRYATPDEAAGYAARLAEALPAG